MVSVASVHVCTCKWDVHNCYIHVGGNFGEGLNGNLVNFKKFMIHQ